MTLTEQRKLAKHVCRLLKVSEITFPIGRTPKGNLGLTFNANNDEYEIMLDSIPLSTRNALEDENNIELKAMIEKYMFQQKNVFTTATNNAGGSGGVYQLHPIVGEVSQEKEEKPTEVTKSKK